MSDSDTIEVSSTTTTSCGRRLARSWRKRLWLPGLQPSSRCSVEALEREQLLADASSTSSARASAWTASSSRAAALPVGAASATSGGGRPRARRLLGEQREDPRDGRRLAGAGAARDDREAPRAWRSRRRGAGGRRRRRANSRGEARRPAARRRRRAPRPVARARAGPPRPALLAPVAIEVQARADEAQRPARRVVVLAARDERAAPRARSLQAAGSGHGSADRSTGSSRSTVACSAIVARST